MDDHILFSKFCLPRTAWSSERLRRLERATRRVRRSEPFPRKPSAGFRSRRENSSHENKRALQSASAQSGPPRKKNKLPPKQIEAPPLTRRLPHGGARKTQSSTFPLLLSLFPFNFYTSPSPFSPNFQLLQNSQLPRNNSTSYLELLIPSEEAKRGQSRKLRILCTPPSLPSSFNLKLTPSLDLWHPQDTSPRLRIHHFGSCLSR